MKRTYYHGTSADNLKSILKHGIAINQQKIWNCSDNAVYLWDVEKLAEVDSNGDDTQQEKEQRAFQRASESAQIATIKSKQGACIVLKIELDEDEISRDDSHENMEGHGAVCIRRAVTPSEIKQIHVSNDLTLLKGYFIGMMLQNELFDPSDLSPVERKIGEAMQKAEIYPKDVDGVIQWEEVKHKPQKKSAVI